MTMLALFLVTGFLLLNAHFRRAYAEEEVTSDNYTASKYNPELLLSTILGFNQTTPRQAGYAFTPDQNFFPTSAPDQASDPGIQSGLQKLKKRRRRRKPKSGVPPVYALQYLGAPAQVPLYYGYRPSGDNSQIYGPPYGPQRRPAPVREGALSAVSRALGSIAKYDDYQCVPRLLCEVASGRDGGGGGGGGGVDAGLLPALLNMQPLIMLLAAYNGMASSPLFVFGRAALLGMTSQGNSASCRYAYPQCPNDPDQLLDYLNNHNGGFFRFFSGVPDAQQVQGPVEPNSGFPQGLQQFYNHLANIPLNQYDQGGLILHNQHPQNYNHPAGIPLNQYNLGNYQYNQNQYQNLNDQQSYGIYQGSHSSKGSYGKKYGYETNIIRFKNNHIDKEDKKQNNIEKRIQNYPAYKFVSNGKTENDQVNAFLSKYIENGNSWSFPDQENQVTGPSNIRSGKKLKFPQNVEITTNKPKKRFAQGFVFPESESNRDYIEYYNYPPLIKPVFDDYPLKTGTGDLKFDASNQESHQQEIVYFGSGDRHFDSGDPDFGREEEYYIDQKEGDVIYVLKGDGDPNNPEVIKWRPGN